MTDRDSLSSPSPVLQSSNSFDFLCLFFLSTSSSSYLRNKDNDKIPIFQDTLVQLMLDIHGLKKPSEYKFQV